MIPVRQTIDTGFVPVHIHTDDVEPSAFRQLQDLSRQTEGVERRKDKGELDEIPAAYRDIDQVRTNQSDLVDVVHTLKQVLCAKG